MAETDPAEAPKEAASENVRYQRSRRGDSIEIQLVNENNEPVPLYTPISVLQRVIKDGGYGYFNTRASIEAHKKKKADAAQAKKAKKDDCAHAERDFIRDEGDYALYKCKDCGATIREGDGQ